MPQGSPRLQSWEDVTDLVPFKCLLCGQQYLYEDTFLPHIAVMHPVEYVEFMEGLDKFFEEVIE